MRSKTIILSNENEKGRGIITLLEEEDYLSIRLRLYNIEKLNKHCKIGIYHNGKAYSANLLEKNGSYLSSIVGEFNINQDFYSALIDTSQNNKVIVSGGTYAGCFFNDSSVFDSPNEQETINEITQELSSSSTPVQEQENNNCNCENCPYKQYFYSNQTPPQNINEIRSPRSLNQNDTSGFVGEILRCTQKDTTSTQKDSSEIQQNKTNTQNNTNPETPAQQLQPQFNYVFENYPSNEQLSSLLPNSKFVEIEEANGNYSIGAIYENEAIKYICYARAGSYNTPAPSELGQHYQWLPLDKEDPLSDGYFIVFQDAKTLSIVEL